MPQTPHLQDRIARRAEALFPELQHLRRDFHQHPELSNQEARTGRVAAEYLAGLGLEVRTGVAGHGVVADLVGARPGRTYAWRADLDALPIQERADRPGRRLEIIPDEGDSPRAVDRLHATFGGRYANDSLGAIG